MGAGQLPASYHLTTRQTQTGNRSGLEDNNFKGGKALSFYLKLEPFVDIFRLLALHRRIMVGNISVDLFILRYTVVKTSQTNLNLMIF